MNNNHFTKLREKLKLDLKSGELSLNEYGLLCYLIQSCDRETGIIVTNSRLVSTEVRLDRKRVSNLLSSLKRKKRLHRPDGEKTGLRHGRGRIEPYPIYLSDAFGKPNIDTHEPQTRHGQDTEVDTDKTRDVKPTTPTTASELDKSKSGNFLAPRSRLDIDRDKDTTTTSHNIYIHKSKKDAKKEAVVVDDEKETRNIQNEINKFKEVIINKYEKQIINPPPESALRCALDEFDLYTLINAVERCPDILMETDPRKVVNVILKFARNKDWGKSSYNQKPQKRRSDSEILRDLIENNIKKNMPLDDEFTQKLIAEKEAELAELERRGL